VSGPGQHHHLPAGQRPGGQLGGLVRGFELSDDEEGRHLDLREHPALGGGISPRLHLQRRHLVVGYREVPHQPVRRWFGLPLGDRLERGTEPGPPQRPSRLTAADLARIRVGHSAEIDQRRDPGGVPCRQLEEDSAPFRIPDHCRLLDSGIVQHRQAVGDVLLQAVCLPPRGQAALLVPSVVHHEVAKAGKLLQVTGPSPHATIAGPTGVEEDRMTAPGVEVVDPNAIPRQAGHWLPRFCRRLRSGA